jgi:hypothetical protein
MAFGFKNLSTATETKFIPTSTGDIKENYHVLDTIFAIDSNSAGFFSGADPSVAFDGVKEQLRKKCASIGGDAVIYCEYQYRVALDGKKQCIEIFAYGTAVKFE